MIVEFGHFALSLALLVALAQGTVPLLGAARRDAALTAFAAPAALLQFALLATAFGIFIRAHAMSDFSVLNVVQNSLSTKPFLYKITGAWGSHEGSMLLWVFILGLYGALVAIFGGELPPRLRARALAIQGLLGFSVLAFILFTSDPFIRVLPAPVDGSDLNPLLQDPGLAVHPPFLYFGYVGFSICYSFALAGLIEGRIDAGWARWVRPWTLLAWAGLSIGIVLGSWWAYYVLGWGGWWYWDPVENASFMPWLLGTALLHSLTVVEKREAMRGWSALFSIGAFGMSLVGTFLVRSGVLTSVHAFALDPARGSFILVMVAVVIGAGLALFAWRAPRLGAGGTFALVSREGALGLNNILLASGMAMVFVGTFYPLFAELVTGDKLSVGPDFFDFAFSFFMVPAVVAMAVAPLLAWRRADPRSALRRLRVAAAAAVVAALVAGVIDGLAHPLMIAGAALAMWCVGGVLTEIAARGGLFRSDALGRGDFWRRLRAQDRRAWGASLAHLGVGVLVAGVTFQTAWRVERVELARPGTAIAIAGGSVTLVEVTDGTRDNYQWQQALLQATLPGRGTFEMRPERRFYPVAGSQTTVTSISTNGFADLYAALGEPDNKGGFTIRLYYNPLVPWIWFGGVLAALGGLLAASARPHRHRQPAALPASAAPAE